MGRRHQPSQALRHGVHLQRPLAHPGALIQGGSHSLAGGRRVGHLAVLEGVQQVDRALLVADHHEHPAQELAHLRHQGGAGGMGQSQRAGHGELIDVGQPLLTVLQLLQCRRVVA